MPKTPKLAEAPEPVGPPTFTSYINQCVYGGGGSGKTSYALRAAQFIGWDRVLWVHTERPIKQYHVPIFTPETPWGVINAQMEGADAIMTYLDAAEAAAARGEWLYDLVVVDSLSENEDVNFAMIEKANPTKKDPRQLWNVQGHDYRLVLWRLASGQRTNQAGTIEPVGLGAHVLVTAHVREVADPSMPRREDGQQATMFKPGMRGQSGAKLEHAFDQVLYMERRADSRRLYLKPKGIFTIKNIFEVAPDGTPWPWAIPEFITLPEMTEEPNPFAEVLRLSGVLA